MSKVALIGRNLLLLAVIIVPLWFVIAWVSGPHTSGQEVSVLRAFAVGYAFIITPVLAAGLIQQLLLTASVAVWPILHRRTFAVATVVVIPLILAPISAPLSVQFSTRFSVATLVALITYALVLRMPPNPERSVR